jgi:hypothetical protein
MTILAAGVVSAARVEIRHGRFFVDDQPFYIRGVGYAPWRPHQHPGTSYTDTNRRWTRMDFERMRAANFNTVRTWDALDPEELALAQANGLWVLQGIWLDTKQDFSDPRNQDAAVRQVQAVAEATRGFDNVLGYLVMTEPSPQAVVQSGVPETLQFFRKLKRAIQANDPRPVSMDSWPPLAFLDSRDFDFVTVNIYSFFPRALTHAMGLAGLVRWHKEHLAPDRPLVIGETGGFAVSQASETAAGGLGGLTEYDQSLRDIESLKETLEGHADGSVLVSWIDTWHYPRDPDTHDNEPWEWDGILGIPTDRPKDLDGIPRQIYRDVGRYNHMIPWEPKANRSYPIQVPQPIEVFGSAGVASMHYSLNEGDWIPLDSAGRGIFQGSFELPRLARKHQSLTFRAMDKDGTVLAKTEVPFLAGVKPEHLLIEETSGRAGNIPRFEVKVMGADGGPVPPRKVYFGCFFPISFREGQGMVTTSQGRADFSCPVGPEEKDRYLYIAAGTDSPERVRTSDLRIFKVGK